MYDGDVQSVLRCGQCNKPFDKESTLKRHGYYCRSRKAGNASRTRSCVACVKRKARCDNRRPECTRCSSKGIDCHYPESTSKDVRPEIQPGDNVSTGQQHGAASLITDLPNLENVQGVINGDNVFPVPDSAFENLEGDLSEWNDLDINFEDFLNPQPNDKNLPYPSPKSSSLTLQSIPSDQTVQVQQLISSPKMNIQILPSLPRSLISRQKWKVGGQRIANLTLHTLRSYPLMMLRHNTLPPFIHPQLTYPTVKSVQMEPLSNCIGLVHMISTEVQGSRKLFWNSVRLECEQIIQEHLNFNKWELLNAMQALSIYLLIRLDEGETEYNNFDFLLLATVTVVAKELRGTNGEFKECNYGGEPTWKDWIYEESRRRLSVVYRVVNLIVYFEPAAMCDLPRDLILAPLPAKKQLWEASDEFMWKTESERDASMRTAYGLAATGELVEIDHARLYCGEAGLLHESQDYKTPSDSVTKWEEWCSGMDGFGGLVMLAASLIV